MGRRPSAPRGGVTVAVIATAIAVGACGSSVRHPSSQPRGKLTVDVPTASFPAAQRLAQHTTMVLAVRNAGARTIPDVSVTVCNVTCAADAPNGEGTSAQPFAQDLNMPNLGSRSRPVWIVDRAPGPCRFSCAAGGSGGASTAYANTWALGALKPGATARFKWAVTAVQPGRHVVAWEVAGDIDGRPTTVLPDGSAPTGTFTVTVARAPARTYITASGRIATVR